MRTWVCLAALALGACGSDGDDVLLPTTSVARAIASGDSIASSPERAVTSLVGQPFFPGEFPGDLSVAPITTGAIEGGTAAERHSWTLTNATGKRSVSITADRSLAATAPGEATATFTGVRPDIIVELRESRLPADSGGPEAMVIAWWVEDGLGVRVAMGGLTEEEQRRLIASMAPAQS